MLTMAPYLRDPRNLRNITGADCSRVRGDVPVDADSTSAGGLFRNFTDVCRARQ